MNNWAEFAGGALACFAGASPSISNCLIMGNSSEAGGGVGILTGASPLLANCVITGNTSGYDAGGLLIMNECSPTVVNCLIAENSAYNKGGGVYIGNSTPHIRCSTITMNLAGDSGAGVFFSYSPAAYLIDTILWGNHGLDYYLEEGLPQITYCDVGGGFAGAGNFDADPNFVIGSAGNFYLSNSAAGEPLDSPCLNCGSNLAGNLTYSTADGDVHFSQLTTRSDAVPDEGVVDVGYHYDPAVVYTPTPITTETPTPWAATPTVAPTAIPTEEPSQAPTWTATASMTLTPTERPTLSPTGTPTLTATPSASPIASSTPAPTWTATPPLLELGVRLVMPASYFSAGDRCSLTALLYNSTLALEDVPLFIILDVYGQYWYWNEWEQDLTYVVTDVPSGITTVPIIAEFIWPETGDAQVLGLNFWGAMLNEAMTAVLGGEAGLGRWTFGYGQP